MNRTITRWGTCAAISAAMLVGLTTQGQAQRSWLKKFRDPNKESITLKHQGYFYVNGRYFTDLGDPNTVGGMRMTGQMYVEFQIPERVKHPYPVVMIHGGSQTAANWMGTIDGGEGWRSFFTANGYAVYLVDQVGRGRSPAYNPLPGYTPTDIVTYGEPFNRPANVLGRERTWTIPEQFLDWPQAALHTQWPSFGRPGAGKPGDPYFDQFFASQIQSRLDRTGLEIQTDMQNAGAALLDEIGPAVIITHSQSGTMGYAIADARPNLVKALVTMEGGGRPTAATGTTWPPASIPLTYSPPVTDPATQLSFVEQPADPTGLLLTCWLQTPSNVHTLPNLARMPHLLLVSEAGSSQRTNHCISQYLTQAGVQNDYVNLKDVGIHGNAHMIMVEKNALETAAFVASWVEDHVERKRRGHHRDKDD
jgi:pimeloyl-ACP methyl ester carboxylesterase